MDVEFGGAIDGVGERAVAAVGEAAHAHDLGAESLEHLDGLERGLAGGDHIFGDEELHAGFHLEAAAQAHHVVHALGEDGRDTQLATQFVGHDDAAHSRTHHHVDAQVFHLLRDFRDHALGSVRVLQQFGTLTVAVAVTAGGKEEMAFQ